MSLTKPQQILEAIKRSSKPLICIPTGNNPDAYATAIGLSRVLKKLDKKPTIAAANGKAPKTIAFLQGHDEILPTLENIRQFVIELDASKTQVGELSYEMKDEKLYVHLSPKKGSWDTKDVRTSSSAYKFDLIICIGAPDFEACAHLYSDNPDFFFRTPIINIDHTPENEHYGQLNAVDMTASACGEVCYDLIESIEPGLIDEQIATAFLTGMIAKTKSFKTKNVTPKTLQTASKLIAKGAKRDEIVHNLFRTRSVSTLKLWGRALARLKASGLKDGSGLQAGDESAGIVWSLLSQQDFMHAGAEEEDLVDVIDELIASSPDTKIIVLLYEKHDRNICAIVRAEKPFDALQLCRDFQAVGTNEEVKMCFVEKTIVEVEKILIAKIQEQMKK